MLSIISSTLWIVATLIITISGIYFSFYFKFPQYKLSKNVKESDKRDVSNSLKLLNLTLAGKIGVGSISGIAISIIIGGPGTIFWIWFSTIILSVLSYLETKTGIKYRKKINNEYIGGPQVYIKDVLKKKKLANFYALLIIFTFLFAFILIQSNTIIYSLKYIFPYSKNAIMFFLLFTVVFSIRKGITGISKIVNFLVPIMGLIYVLIGLYVIISNIELIPNILINIIKDSFQIKSLLTMPLIVGFQRSIFSNELGMGSTSMVVALSNSNDYYRESKNQLIGMYFITLIVCTISAFIILTTNYQQLMIKNINGIEIINYAFNYHFGEYGMFLSNLVVVLFAFSTIVTSYFYGDCCIKYLFKNKKNTFVKIIVIIVIVLSAYISTENIWALVDIATALTTIINLYALYKMRKELEE